MRRIETATLLLKAAVKVLLFGADVVEHQKTNEPVGACEANPRPVAKVRKRPIETEPSESDRSTDLSTDLIPELIKSLRLRLGYTQVEFALDIGASHSSVAGWEKGTHPPSRMALIAIGNLDSKRGADWWRRLADLKWGQL